MKNLIAFISVFFIASCGTYKVNPSGTILDFKTKIYSQKIFKVADSLKASSGQFSVPDSVMDYISNYSNSENNHSQYLYFTSPREVYFIVCYPQGLSIKDIYNMEDYTIITGRDSLSKKEKERITERFNNDFLRIIYKEI